MLIKSIKGINKIMTICSKINIEVTQSFLNLVTLFLEPIKKLVILKVKFERFSPKISKLKISP